MICRPARARTTSCNDALADARRGQLFTVLKLLREIHAGRIGLRRKAARHADSIDAARAGRQMIQPGPNNRTCHVDDELPRTRRMDMHLKMRRERIALNDCVLWRFRMKKQCQNDRADRCGACIAFHARHSRKRTAT